MSETIATWLVNALGVYAGLGLVFGVAFVVRGAASIDPQAVGASRGFRLAILPGVVVLWPLVARRGDLLLLRAEPGAIRRNRGGE